MAGEVHAVAHLAEGAVRGEVGQEPQFRFGQGRSAGSVRAQRRQAGAQLGRLGRERSQVRAGGAEIESISRSIVAAPAASASAR